ncbi:MAG: hypothetical protein JKY54_15745, partial [Flavobacteriales bacterium]|nr:hypothetical protein [Flavobacteriales bacterium]
MNLIKWFEIPVENLDRAVGFYSNVFRISFNVQLFSGIRHAIFKSDIESLNISGALVEIGKFNDEQIGPILFFDANAGMTDIIENVEEYGGKVL